MYCVIQKIKNKKCNRGGEGKKLEVTETNFSIFGGNPNKCYGYIITGKFERPIKTAYKISIHRSYRENGKVKKKQWVLCTMAYYDLTRWSLYDYADSKINQVSEETGVSVDDIYNMVNEKLEPIIAAVKKEYEATEEYKTKVKHNKILREYFEDKYGKNTYDYCYDVFGVLRNEEYLKELEANYKAQQEYNRSYYENFKNNYSNYDFGSYFNKNVSTYTEDEKGKLKKIYRVLAAKFHPDISKDDGEMMKLVNKLKDEWDI